MIIFVCVIKLLYSLYLQIFAANILWWDPKLGLKNNKDGPTDTVQLWVYFIRIKLNMSHRPSGENASLLAPLFFLEGCYYSYLVFPPPPTPHWRTSLSSVHGLAARSRLRAPGCARSSQSTRRTGVGVNVAEALMDINWECNAARPPPASSSHVSSAMEAG